MVITTIDTKKEHKRTVLQPGGLTAKTFKAKGII